MRSYLQGDEVHWARIITDSFGGRERTAQDTRDQITGRGVFLPDGTLLRKRIVEHTCRNRLCLAAICR